VVRSERTERTSGTNAFPVATPVAHDREGFQMSTTDKEIIEQAYASFGADDSPAALGALRRDIRWTEPDGYPIAGTYVGPQAVLEDVFMRLGEIGDHFAVVPEQFVADGDTVVALGHLSWKHKDTGTPASVETAHVWTFRDGNAATFRQHIDIVRVRGLS
jgi:ketosteroid isomerase-like protein